MAKLFAAHEASEDDRQVDHVVPLSINRQRWLVSDDSVTLSLIVSQRL